MNVVGRVGSLISQGVYSVATPFHPFGGAVDIIVVEQQDGTYRTTPWYVRFGKFQGVLKGAVKVVRISVNGVEADFHMYLDNSGEAYFFREVVSEKDDDGYQDLTISHLPESIQEDNINDQSSHPNGSVSDAEDTESLNGHGFLRTDEIGNGEFHDNHSQDSLVESPVYSAYRYESLDHVEDLVKSQVLDSEVVLVTRDGHVLLAPISSCAENADNLQLSTPHFDLYPGDVEEVAIEHLHVSADFARNKADLSNSKDVWPDNLLGDLEASTSNSGLENCVPINEDNTSSCVNEASEDGQKSSHQAQEAQNPGNCTSEDIHGSMTRNDIFKSCLELSELNSDAEEDSLQNECFVSVGLAKDNGTHGLEETSPCSHPSVQESESKAGRDIKIETNDSIPVPKSVTSCSCDSPTVQVQVDDAVKCCLRDGDTRYLGSKSVSFNLVIDDLEPKEDESRDESQELGAEHSKSDIFESQSAVSDRGINSGFEISLCGELLHAGMGLDSANEAFNAHRVTKEEFKVSGSSIIKNEKLIVRYKERYLPWDKAAPILLGMTVFGLDFPPEPEDAIHVEQDEKPKSGEEEDNSIISTPSRRWRLWSIPFRRAKSLQRTSSNASSDDVFVDSESCLQSPRVGPTISGFEDKEFPPKKFLRTNIPTSEQIASLNLKDGQNKIAFSFNTRVLGEQQVDAHIYLWKWNTRIVISDVDGTITRSDVLGQFMPLFGKDWTQSGVARLFSAIKENGYQLLFLSARAIVQAYLTRSFLVNLKQDGKALPNGPVVISPDGLIPSLYREVIRRKPHEFKIACLEDIRALFPSDYNPFYAGFGNRETDEISYRKIGIPEGKIFIINPKGEVNIHRCIDAKSYTSLHTLVNDMFPPTSLVEQEAFNSWNYWKTPLPNIDC